MRCGVVDERVRGLIKGSLVVIYDTIRVGWMMMKEDKQ